VDIDWKKVTAVATISTTGAVTGFSLVPKAHADLKSPTGLPVTLTALERSIQAPNASAMRASSSLRVAIVTVARHYLQLAQHKTPAQMEALVWEHASTDHVDHGDWCAAFASLVLEAGAHAVGQESWVAGGTTYPWPLHKWADVRVDPNSASLGITSVVQDAEAHHRWHALGDGYAPKPGDWVLFPDHIEVVTSFTGGVLHTIGGNSDNDLSVNANEYPQPLAQQGVTGFVNNGHLAPTQARPVPPVHSEAHQAKPARVAVPGLPRPVRRPEASPAGRAAPVIPGLPAPRPAPRKHHHAPPVTAPVDAATSQAAFIREVAPGAVAAQEKYGVPAAVTIAQAIDESGFGTSTLASHYHNLFGVKGQGPAGSVSMPSQEYVNGVWETVTSPFRVYRNVAQSIDDHGDLLANSGYYGAAMGVRHNPDEFANALTGVYATDPSYGSKLIGLMRQYGLYKYDQAPTPVHPHARVVKPAPPPAPASAPSEHLVAPKHHVGAPSATSSPVIPGVLPLAPPVTHPKRSSHALVKLSDYQQQSLPLATRAHFVRRVRKRLMEGYPLHVDAADRLGIPWEVLAACDWLQCRAHPKYSPVHGERLGRENLDGTAYHTKSQALTRAAQDLVALSREVYGVDLASPHRLSVPELAAVFAAYRWGALLRAYGTSPMEFPYSVAGLSLHHMHMRWPRIPVKQAPDKPGRRYRAKVGGVPLVLALGYSATT
jgi:hypothetical protein